MLPEVRVLLERAEARRQSLLGLVEAVPEDYWGRGESQDSWRARTHLEHLAAMEPLVARLLTDVVAEGVGVVAGAVTMEELGRARERAMAVFEGKPIAELREAMGEGLARVRQALGKLEPGHLDAAVSIGGATDAWGQPVTWHLREYLRTWAEHDGEHEAAIRAAITTPPDLSAVALGRLGLRAKD